MPRKSKDESLSDPLSGARSAVLSAWRSCWLAQRNRELLYTELRTVSGVAGVTLADDLFRIVLEADGSREILMIPTSPKAPELGKFYDVVGPDDGKLYDIEVPARVVSGLVARGRLRLSLVDPEPSSFEVDEILGHRVQVNRPEDLPPVLPALAVGVHAETAPSEDHADLREAPSRYVVPPRPVTPPGSGPIWLSAVIACATIVVVAVVATGFAGGLGEDAGVAKAAVWSICAVGGWVTVRNAMFALEMRTPLHQIGWSVERFAEAGGSLPDCANYARNTGVEITAACDDRVAGGANLLILLGMLCTAGYLAWQAPSFVTAATMLKDDKSEGLAPAVALLLGLGPKAFLATASAVAASMIVGAAGQRNVHALRTELPDESQVLIAWHRGRAVFAEAEADGAALRDRKLLDVALSNRSVAELNASLRHAADVFAGLKEATSGLGSAATQIVQSESALRNVVGSFERSDKRASELAEALQSLSAEVRSYSQTMLATSQEFGNALLKQSTEQGARLVSEGLQQTMTGLQPEFKRLAMELHDSLKSSADVLRNRAADEFTNAVHAARQDLQTMDGTLRDFSKHVSGLVNDLERWSRDVERNGAVLRNALGALGDSLDPGARALPALQAVERARAELERSSSRLASASSELVRGMDAVRKNAEILGRVREVTSERSRARLQDPT